MYFLVRSSASYIIMYVGVHTYKKRVPTCTGFMYRPDCCRDVSRTNGVNTCKCLAVNMPFPACGILLNTRLTYILSMLYFGPNVIC